MKWKVNRLYLDNLLIRHSGHQEVLFVFVRVELDAVRHLPVGEAGDTLACRGGGEKRVGGLTRWGELGIATQQLFYKGKTLLSEVLQRAETFNAVNKKQFCPPVAATENCFSVCIR